MNVERREQLKKDGQSVNASNESSICKLEEEDPQIFVELCQCVSVT